MRFFVKIICLCLALLFIVPAFALAQKGNSPYITSVTPVSGVAAVVNGEMISLHDLQQQSLPEIMRARISKSDSQAQEKINAIQRKILDSMIIDLLLGQEAERLKLKTPDSEVDAEIKKILTNNKIDQETLERSLAAQGLSLEFLKKRIRSNFTSSKLMKIMVTHKVVVPKAEMEKYYNEHPKEFMKDKKVTLQVILFAPTLSAEVPGIIGKVKSGSLSFEKAAQQYSSGPNAKEGGNLGEMPWENLSPLWRKHLVGVPVGSMTEVFKMEQADTVIKLVAQQEGVVKPYQEAEPEVEMALKEPLLQERFEEYTQQLRDKAVIEIRFK